MNQTLPRFTRDRRGTMTPAYHQPTHAVAIMPEVISIPAPQPSVMLSMFQGLVNKLAMLDNMIREAQVQGYAVSPATSQMIPLNQLLLIRPELVQKINSMRVKLAPYYSIPAAIAPFGASLGKIFKSNPHAANTAKLAAQAAAKAAKEARSKAAKEAKLIKQAAAAKAKADKLAAKLASAQGGTVPIPTPSGAVVNPQPAIPVTVPTAILGGGGGGMDSGLNWGQNYTSYDLPPVLGDDYNPFPIQGGPPETSTIFENPFSYEETQGEVLDWGNPFVPRNDSRQLLDAIEVQNEGAAYDYIEDPKDWMASISPFGADPSLVRVVNVRRGSRPRRMQTVQSFAGIEGIIGSLISAGGAIGAAALAPKVKNQAPQQLAMQQQQQPNYMPMIGIGLGAVALLVVLINKRK